MQSYPRPIFFPNRCTGERNAGQGVVGVVSAGFGDAVTVGRGDHASTIIVGAGVERRAVVTESRQLATVGMSACDVRAIVVSELGQHTYNIIRADNGTGVIMRYCRGPFSTSTSALTA